MPQFELVSDQTNMLRSRLVTWRCQSCQHDIIINEFPFKNLPPTVMMPCETCDLIKDKVIARFLKNSTYGRFGQY